MDSILVKSPAQTFYSGRIPLLDLIIATATCAAASAAKL